MRQTYWVEVAFLNIESDDMLSVLDIMQDKQVILLLTMCQNYRLSDTLQ